MSGFDEYGKHDAVSLAALVNSGETNETELLDEALSPVSYTHLRAHET